MKIPIYRKKIFIAYAVVDDVDSAWAKFNWHLTKAGYVYRNLGRGRTAYLHRDIMGASKGIQVDHEDGNPLNNRRNNLRLVTRAQQQQNLASHCDSTSRHRGVHWDAQRQRWSAEVMVAGKRYRLGRFRTEQEAAEAAQQCRIECMTHNNENRHLIAT